MGFYQDQLKQDQPEEQAKAVVNKDGTISLIFNAAWVKKWFTDKDIPIVPAEGFKVEARADGTVVFTETGVVK